MMVWAGWFWVGIAHAVMPGSGVDVTAAIAAAREKVQAAVLYVKCERVDTSDGRRLTESVSGSAFLIDTNGEFVTNWHVVDKAASIRCLLTDGRHFDAELLGSDKSSDLALCRLRLPAGEQVPCAAFGTSDDLAEGDFVIAMGAPWGLNRSVTVGAISCARRYLGGHSEYTHWIQTDTAIGPGNSGGPLVNLRGQVIGINALGTMLPGANFGFAIPADEARVVIDLLRRDGKVNWSWCGLDLQPLRDFEHNIYFAASNGVIVAGTAPDSPARRAGVMPQDRIIRINGVPANGLTEEALPDLRRRIALLPESEAIALEIVRGGEKLALILSPRAKGRVEGEERAFKRWNFSAKSINQFETPVLFLRRKAGVYVFGVTSPGNAERAGMQRHDIILSIAGHEITSLDALDDVHRRVTSDGAEPRVSVRILRNGRPRELSLDFSRDFERVY